MRVTIVVNELDSHKPYSLEFELDAVPTIGSYISIQRPDVLPPHGEDLIVRHVWWRLQHPETGGYGSEPPKIGGAVEIFIECQPAIGPYSSDRWRDNLERLEAAGHDVERFNVSRLSIRQDEMGG